ncbi:unnamed protein product, partial [Allacma fusca]
QTILNNDKCMVCRQLLDDTTMLFEFLADQNTEMTEVKAIEIDEFWVVKVKQMRLSLMMMGRLADQYMGMWSKNGGSRHDKLAQLDKYVFERFVEARDDCKIVRKFDLRRCTLQYPQVLRNFPFKARQVGCLLRLFTKSVLGKFRVVGKREIIDRIQLHTNCQMHKCKSSERIIRKSSYGQLIKQLSSMK